MSIEILNIQGFDRLVYVAFRRHLVRCTAILGAPYGKRSCVVSHGESGDFTPAHLPHEEMVDLLTAAHEKANDQAHQNVIEKALRDIL